ARPREQSSELARRQAEAAWEQGREPSRDDALTHLFAPPRAVPATPPVTDGPRLTMQQALRQTLEDEMARDQTILVFGEDVGAFGGVRRVTEGLQAVCGEARCSATTLH